MYQLKHFANFSFGVDGFHSSSEQCLSHSISKSTEISLKLPLHTQCVCVYTYIFDISGNWETIEIGLVFRIDTFGIGHWAKICQLVAFVLINVCLCCVRTKIKHKIAACSLDTRKSQICVHEMCNCNHGHRMVCNKRCKFDAFKRRVFCSVFAASPVQATTKPMYILLMHSN